MKKNGVFVAFLSLALGALGCARITSQVVERPRVDQELKGGNRGFLVGSAPEAGQRKSTRKIVQTDIEMPTATELNPWRVKKEGPQAPAAAVATAQAAPAPEPPRWNPASEPVREPVRERIDEEPPAAVTRYTVKSGDTLEKISAKVYGDSSQWRRIFEANRDKLKSPNRIYAGQKLVIPARHEGSQAAGGPLAESQRKRRASSGDLK